MNSRGKKSKRKGSGVIDTWKLWRHCMCRHGWYPLIVAPFITTAGLLDIYSSLNCAFIRVDVGFTPVNDQWSEEIIDVGFWSYQVEKNESIDMLENQNRTQISTQTSSSIFLLPHCSSYDEAFKNYFIQGDRAWTAAKIMALSSGIASITIISTIWLMTLCPLPACFVWPGVLLPAALIGFLAGGAKFFILDSELCTKKLWLRDGALTRETAKSCSLQQGAISSIASICCYFICVCLIFYNVPDKRELDPNYGEHDDFDDDENLEAGIHSHHNMINQTMEMIPEELPFRSDPRKHQLRYSEQRDSAVLHEMHNVHRTTPQEDRNDNEIDDVDSVMAKIGIYLKESGSQIDFDDVVSVPKTKSYQKQPSYLSQSEREHRRHRHAKSVLSEDSHRSNVSLASFESRRSKLRDKVSKNEPTAFKDADDMYYTNANISKLDKIIKDENACDISSITIDNIQNASLNGREASRQEANNYVSKQSKNSQKKSNIKSSDSVRVY